MISRTGLVQSLTLGGVVLGLAAWTLQSVGREPQVEGKGQIADKRTVLFYGSQACGPKCHDLAEPRKDEKFPPICRCIEYNIWKDDDKHRDAYTVLEGPRGKQMSDILGYKVHENAACLACHAVNTVKKDEDPTFDIKEGVSCGVCHGFYADWVSKHSTTLVKEREFWRGLPRDVKETTYGMKDLWNPAKRATLCSSCHVGNPGEGKVVTHAMYAAGHPPLPGLEVATFSNQMPRHWQYLKEKQKDMGEKAKEVLEKVLKFNPQDVNFEETQLVLISGVVAFRDNVSVLAGLTKADGKDGQASAWPELAAFDCYACHHELKKDGWHQRQLTTKPGRPQMRPWSTELVKLALYYVGGSQAELDGAFKGLQDAFDAQPFGDAKAIHPAAASAVKWADGLIGRVLTAKLDANKARSALRQLTALKAKTDKNDGDLLDYDSARQILWAVDTITDEMHRADAKAPGYQAVQSVLKEIEPFVRLKLPATRKTSIVDHLETNLNLLNNYNPFEFQKRALQLHQALEK